MIEEHIKENEGLRLKPYRCTAGKLTIGYGHNLDDLGISQGIADMIFQEDLARAVEQARQVFPDLTEYPEEVITVVVDMVFNLGLTRFEQFKRFISAIKERNYKLAVAEIDNSLYAKQVPNRARKNMDLLLSV